MAIVDTKRENGLPVHISLENPEALVGKTIIASVDAERRQAIACNHSATHLVHYALREVLGKHVEQKGSLVTPESLRFDFSHFQKVTPEELRKAEQIANELIRADYALQESRHTPIAKAKAMGAMALFGEKYGDDVRVIQYGPSIELCGGCHVSSTGRIGSVRIVMETSVAAGIRRIEAVTAKAAEEVYAQESDLLQQARLAFNNTKDLVGSITKLQEENASLKKQLEEAQARENAAKAKALLSQIEQVGNLKLLRLVGNHPATFARDMVPTLQAEFDNERFALVAATECDGKPSLTVYLSKPLIAEGKSAGAIIKSAATFIQGGGGGQAMLATAGGRNAEGLPKALEAMLQALV